MDWTRLLQDPPWWLKTCACFALGLTALAVLRSGVFIWHYGFRNYLRSTFRLDPDAWMIIGILMFVAIASMATFLIPGGAPWRLIP